MCCSESFTIMKFDGALNQADNHTDINPPGEFLFLKLSVKVQPGVSKTFIIGNIYRSPSGKVEKFLELLDANLNRLSRHKNKNVTLVGDFNVDLIKHDTDIHSQNLINLTAGYGFAQIVSLPTRITDHSVTLIDHVYTNQVHISDHLGTYVCINLDPNFVREAGNSEPHEYIKIRKFNASNMATFTELLRDENWDAVYAENSTEAKFESFVAKFNQHYDAAFKQSSVRRKYQRKDPKPWILPWLEEACARRKKIYHDFVKDPTPANKQKYVKMKKFVDKHIKLAKNKYYKNYFEQYKDNSKKQWQMINSLLNRNTKKAGVAKLQDSNSTVI